MSLFVAAFALHVLAAILGVGPVVALAIGSSRAARESALDRSDILAPLSRWVSLGLGLMLITGILMDVGAGGIFHKAGWFRASGLLLVFIGVLNALARRRLRTSQSATHPQGLRFVARASWLMCATVAVITLLMTLKPG
jgi:hypothetical protein